MATLKTRLSLIGLSMLLFVLTGCGAMLNSVPGRYNPNPVPPITLNIPKSGDGLLTNLNYIIEPGSPQVWLRDIKHREFCLDYSTQRQIYVEKVQLLDLQGRYISSETPDLAQSPSEMQKKSQEQTMAMVGDGVFSQLGNIILGPVPGLIYGFAVITGKYDSGSSDAAELEKLHSELKKRQLVPPIYLDRGAKIFGCHYFPPVNAKEFVITYKNSEYDRQVKQIRIFIEGRQNLVPAR